MNTDRKTIVLMSAVLIACCCYCMVTKEGLEENPCSWIIPADETNTRTCDACPSGKTLIVSPGTGVITGFKKYTCGISP